MKKLIAIALLSALCSCAVTDLLTIENGGSVSRYADSAEPDYEYSETSIDKLNDHAYKLLDDIKISDNEKNIQEGINTLLDDLDLLANDKAYAQVKSYLKWDDEDLESKSDSISEEAYIAFEALAFVFSKGYASDEYSHLFKNM